MCETTRRTETARAALYSNPTATRVETVFSVDKKTPLIPHMRDSTDSRGPHIRYGSAILGLLISGFRVQVPGRSPRRSVSGLVQTHTWVQRGPPECGGPLYYSTPTATRIYETCSRLGFGTRNHRPRQVQHYPSAALSQTTDRAYRPPPPGCRAEHASRFPASTRHWHVSIALGPLWDQHPV